jgi:hypothetical protein
MKGKLHTLMLLSYIPVDILPSWSFSIINSNIVAILNHARNKSGAKSSTRLLLTPMQLG